MDVVVLAVIPLLTYVARVIPVIPFLLYALNRAFSLNPNHYHYPSLMELLP
jgi:hypothetical protein